MVAVKHYLGIDAHSFAEFLRWDEHLFHKQSRIDIDRLCLLNKPLDSGALLISKIVNIDDACLQRTLLVWTNYVLFTRHAYYVFIAIFRTAQLRMTIHLYSEGDSL